MIDNSFLTILHMRTYMGVPRIPAIDTFNT